MSARSAGPIAIRAPAKLNLGLEILGRREDGLHEIRTLMAMLDFGDDVLITSASNTTVRGVPGVARDTNLIARAVDAFATTSGIDVRAVISVTKRVPLAAGLGGASTDAAATIYALNCLTDAPVSHADLLSLAAGLGSDVPFFLGSPLALSTGTGTDLTPLDPVPFEVFLIDPGVTIPNKTRSLYASLEERDFSGGSRIDTAASLLKGSNVPCRDLLANAFDRPLFNLNPELGALRETLERIDSLAVGTSGAGPVQYVIPLQDRIEETEHNLRTFVPSHITIIRTRTRLTPLEAESLAVAGATES